MATSRVSVGLASAVSLVAGVGLGYWLLERPPIERPALAAAPSAAPGESEALGSVLRELQRSVEALTRVLERRPLAEASPSREALRDVGGLDRREALVSGELGPALLALADAIAALRSDAERDSSTQELVTPTWVDREAAFLATGMREAALSESEAAWARAERAFRVKHLFKTYQEMLSTYGAPDQIGVDNTRSWEYMNRFEGGEERFYFGFDQGKVFEVSYDFDRQP